MADRTVVGLVRDELRRITDRGELASRSELQAAVGVGAGDLQAALDVLRDAGEASEVEPDGFRLGLEDDDEPPARVAGAPGVTVEEFEEQPPRRVTAVQVGGYREEYGGPAQVTMPRAVAAVLDAQALGALVKAGIDTTDAGETFVFEVTP